LVKTLTVLLSELFFCVSWITLYILGWPHTLIVYVNESKFFDLNFVPPESIIVCMNTRACL